MSAQGDYHREKNRERDATPSPGSRAHEKRQNGAVRKRQQLSTTITGLPATTSDTTIRRTNVDEKPNVQITRQPLAGQKKESRRAPQKSKPSGNRDPHCTNHCPYEAFVDGGKDEEVRESRSRDRDPQESISRSRSTSRTRSLARKALRKKGPPDIINDEAKAVPLGILNSFLQTDEKNKASKDSVFNLRIESVEHWKQDGHFIRFAISVTITRGNATLQDTTFKLRFRSSDKMRLLPVTGYGVPHDQPLGDALEVHRTAQRTISGTVRLAYGSAGGEVQGQSQQGQEWTERDRYKLELSNPSNDLDARLCQTVRTGAITPPISFRIHVDVECPKGDGLDVIGRIEAQGPEKFVAMGKWSTVDLNKLITRGKNLDTQLLPEGITGSEEDIENYLSLTKLLNASGTAGGPVAQWCLPILERHMRKKEGDRKRRSEEEEKQKREEERKRRASRNGDRANGVAKK